MFSKGIWFIPHIGSCFIAYLLFFASFIISVIFLVTKKEKLESVIDKITALGFMFFTFGIILGSVWAAEAWGHFWGWDPKETWALVVWFIYAGYILNRFVKKEPLKKCLVFNLGGFCFMIFNFLLVTNIFPSLHVISNKFNLKGCVKKFLQIRPRV